MRLLARYLREYFSHSSYGVRSRLGFQRRGTRTSAPRLRLRLRELLRRDVGTISHSQSTPESVEEVGFRKSGKTPQVSSPEEGLGSSNYNQKRVSRHFGEVELLSL